MSCLGLPPYFIQRLKKEKRMSFKLRKIKKHIEIRRKMHFCLSIIVYWIGIIKESSKLIFIHFSPLSSSKRYRQRSKSCTTMWPSCVCLAGLFLFWRWDNCARRLTCQGCTDDDHYHIRWCHQQQQHRAVQGNFQWQTQESKWLWHQGDLLRIAQVHQLLSCPGDTSQRTWNCRAFNNVSKPIITTNIYLFWLCNETPSKQIP